MLVCVCVSVCVFGPLEVFCACCKGQGPLCKGEYHIPSLLGPAADVSTSKLWNPFLSRVYTHTHTHTRTQT